MSIIITSTAVIPAGAIDQDFYSSNNIPFFGPDAVGPCTTSTNSGSSSVSIEDKIAQTMIAGFDIPNDTTKTAVQKFKFAGVYFNGKIDGSVNKATFNEWNSGLPSQLIVASDDEGGQIQRFVSDQKSAKEMGTMDNTALFQHAQKIAGELKERGVTNLLAPVLDLDTGNRNAISPYDRSFSSSGAVITQKAGVYSDAMNTSNIGVTFKHFPGIGKNTANTDNEYQRLNLTIDQMQDDLVPYRDLLKKSKAAVMMSNMVLTGWGDDPVGLNKNAVDYLRGPLGFQGVIMTDDIGVFASYASNKISLKDAVVKAYNAGITMPLFRFTSDNEINDVISAVKAQVPETIIDEAYKKTITFKNEIGLKSTTTIFDSTTKTPEVTAGDVISTGDESSPASSTSSVVNLEDNDARKQYIFQALLGLGFTKEKAAAIWGNLAQESGDNLDPKALEARGSGTPGYTGHGIVQWSWARWRTDYGNTKDVMRTPNAARTSDLTDFQPYPPKEPLDENTLLGFAKSLNKPWYDLGVQLAFIKKEMSPGGAREVPSFVNSTSTNIEELTLIFGRKYESPSESDANWPNRISKANLALQKYGNLPPIDPGSGITSGIASGCVGGGPGGSTGGPTGEGNSFTEGLLTVPQGAYGRNVWYYNQINANLNATDNFYKKNGHSWGECGCGPTAAITIVSSFDNKPTDDPAGILGQIAAKGGVTGGCPGVVAGIQQYFKDSGYQVVDIAGRKAFHSLTKADFDGIRRYLKEGYLIFAHTQGHFLGIYAADDNGNFWLFDSGARSNSTPQKSFTEEQLNSGSGMGGPSAGFGLNELWAAKK
ncbi:MAG: phage tail tip lysozyme [Candidatus Saccharimonas sp.]